MNAKTEFIKKVEGKEILCARIEYRPDYDETEPLVLPINYSAEEYSRFLESLDFEYDEGYGSQELYGTIWYQDGTWSDRAEYDGSEWWAYNKTPEIPKECQARP